MTELSKIGFGGGCHWCTEAVFSSLKGVHLVDQGWISSITPNQSLSEAVVVHYDSSIIDLTSLICIHLHTHKSTSNHSMRAKYRSAVYYFNESHESIIKHALSDVQEGFDESIITQALPFSKFKMSEPQYQNYYYTNPQKPFCVTYINPKLKLLMEKFSEHLPGSDTLASKVKSKL